MDVNIILNAAQQFLLTPQGQDLLKKIDIEDVDKVTKAIKVANEEGKLKKSNKTPEEKKLAREQFISSEYKRLKEEQKEKVGNELAKYEPYIQKFTVKGRIFDYQTNEPIEGIEVKPQLCVFPVSNDLFIYGEDVVRKNRITDKPLLDSEGNARYKAVRDKDLKDPKNFNVSNEGDNFFVKTDENGEFEITIGLPILDASPTRIIAGVKAQPFFYYKDNNNSPQTTSQRMDYENGEFNGSQYAPSIQILTSQTGEVPSELRIHSLFNIDNAAEVAKDKAVEEINQFVIDKVDPYLSLAETFLTNLRKSVLKPATVIQTMMLPLAFELMIFFGIAKEEQANQLQSQCPSNERLADIIKKRNSIVRQLNNIYLIIATNTALAFLFTYLSTFFTFISDKIASLSFPVAVGGAGVPYSIISRLEGIQDLLEDLSDVNKDLKKQLIISLIFLIISMIIILRYLKTIDKLIEGCETTDRLEVINAELLALSEQATEQGSPEKKIVNGFDMSVEVADKAQVGDLPRRQAIAKNSKGITILKGEPSFSAEDQILIDELAFYIQINNLKAD